MQTNYNSAENQRIKSKLVERGIRLNFNQIIEALEKSGEFNVMNIEYQYTKALYNNEEITEAQKDALVEALENEISINCNGDGGEAYDLLNEQIEVLEALEFDIYPDVMEYWQVSEYMAKQLTKQGEVIFQDVCGFKVWGRTCSGQSIMMDGVINDIACDMNILVDQSNSWHEESLYLLLSSEDRAIQTFEDEGIGIFIANYDAEQYEVMEILPNSKIQFRIWELQGYNKHLVITKEHYTTLANQLN